MKRTAKGAMLLTAAALSGGIVGCGEGDSPEKLSKHTYEVGVACKNGYEPFIPSTDTEADGGWADVDVACTDGSVVSRPLGVTKNVNQAALDGFITVNVRGGDEVEMDIQDSNIRISPEPRAGDTEMTVRKLAFDNIDILGSVVVTEGPVPVNP